MKRTLKILSLILCFFLFRLTLSCCRCPEPIVYYDYNTISIRNLDNSTWRATYTDADTMFAAAVAFEIQTSDSTIWSDPVMAYKKSNSGIPSAYAMEPCDCPFTYTLRNDINLLSILTLKDISPDIPAGTEVTDRFLWSNQTEYLYHPIDSLRVNLNTPFLAIFAAKTFRLFSTDTIGNEHAQFAVSLHFSDGQILSDTTHLIHIKQSN